MKTFPNSRRAVNAQAFIDIIDRETGTDTAGNTGNGDTQEPQTGEDTTDTQEPQTGEDTTEPQTAGETQPEEEGGLGNADEVLGNTR